MKKRLLVLLLVVALAVTVSMFTATAETPADNDPTDGTAYCYACKTDITTWTAWDGTYVYQNSTHAEHLHLYLTETVTATNYLNLKGVNSSTGNGAGLGNHICLHMNGKNFARTDGILLSMNYGSVLNVMDQPGSTSYMMGKSSASGAVAQLWNNTEVSLYNVDFISADTSASNSSGGTYKLYGGCFGMNKGVLNLYGDTTISNGKSIYGGNVCLNSAGCALNMYDNSQLSGGVATSYGGNICVRAAGATVTINDNAVVTGGTASESGGNIAITTAAGEVTISDSAMVTGGSSQYGSGGIGITVGTLNIEGGEISGNRTKTGTAAKQHGGNILLNGASAKVNMTGGTVAGGFDLQTYTNGNVTLSGTAKITGSDLAADDTNGYKAMVGALVIETTQRITLGEFAEGAKVRVMFGTGATATGAIAPMPEGKQIRDFAPYIHGQYAWGNALYVNSSNELAMLGNCDAMIVPQDDYIKESTMIKYAYLTDALAEVDAATEMIYMKNVDAGSNADDRRTYADPIAIDKDVVIDLNGVAIDGTFAVAEGKTLTLVDVTADDDLVNGPTSSVKVTGNLAKSTEHPYWGANYIVLQDAETGVAVPHYFSAKVDKAFVKTDEAAVYFGVTFKCDPVLAAAVEDFGMVTWLESKSDYKFYTKETEMVVTDGVNQTTGVEIYDIVKTGATDPSNAARAAEKMVVTAYASFNNGTELNSAELSYSLTEIMGLMDEKWDSVSDQEAIYNFYNTWKTETGWEFANIVAPGAAE